MTTTTTVDPFGRSETLWDTPYRALHGRRDHWIRLADLRWIRTGDP